MGKVKLFLNFLLENRHLITLIIVLSVASYRLGQQSTNGTIKKTKAIEMVRSASIFSCAQGALNIINIHYKLDNFKEIKCDEQAKLMLDMYNLGEKKWIKVY